MSFLVQGNVKYLLHSAWIFLFIPFAPLGDPARQTKLSEARHGLYTRSWLLPGDFLMVLLQ
jgi:hypothetical protein